jgi:hypothetical protein
VHPFPEIGKPEDVYEMEDFGSAHTNVQNTTTHKIGEGPKTDIDLASSIFYQEYEEFELRIFHRKNRFTIQYLFYLFLLPNSYLNILMCSYGRLSLQDWL